MFPEPSKLCDSDLCISTQHVILHGNHSDALHYLAEVAKRFHHRRFRTYIVGFQGAKPESDIISTCCNASTYHRQGERRCYWCGAIA